MCAFLRPSRPPVKDAVVSIHATDPFATPEEHRSPVRRLRGRLPAAVTLWTAPGPAGLTLSSTLIADGDPAGLLGLIDEESELWTATQACGLFAVTLLTPMDRQLADRFAGLLPAPGGQFAGAEWRDTEYGPIPAGHGTWVGCALEDARRVGWAWLVQGVVRYVEAGDDPPLLHYRGRYRELG
jgi:3-hydroxy-9,10-secoandrosta-1,3,5(10)-triene-9,17-dione monooxygenase reductase component